MPIQIDGESEEVWGLAMALKKSPKAELDPCKQRQPLSSSEFAALEQEMLEVHAFVKKELKRLNTDGPRELTPYEIELLKQDTKISVAWMQAKLKLELLEQK